MADQQGHRPRWRRCRSLFTHPYIYTPQNIYIHIGRYRMTAWVINLSARKHRRRGFDIGSLVLELGGGTFIFNNRPTIFPFRSDVVERK